MKTNWFRENIRSIIALLTVSSCLSIILFFAFTGKVNEIILTATSNILMFVFGYYFSASKDKPKNVLIENKSDN